MIFLFKAKPEFERTPNQTTEAYEARWIQFRCIANGHPKPEIRWMHNGNIIPSTYNLIKEYISLKKRVKTGYLSSSFHVD